ncbi:hypothetical protein ACIQ7Q_20530 [Streptomyces sp. NPDC096176]|uniref:hypothetical protein n=1 Tax=Streptomyces sp. NPDC096176 TaxID=3366079 RepID=UPI0037F9037E
MVSTNLGNADSVCAATDTIAKEGVRGLSPLGLPQTSSNVITSWKPPAEATCRHSR